MARSNKGGGAVGCDVFAFAAGFDRRTPEQKADGPLLDTERGPIRGGEQKRTKELNEADNERN
jgi:hypothetical protein